MPLLSGFQCIIEGLLANGCDDKELANKLSMDFY